jgi:glucose/arabinose dehydrogenase
MQSNKSPWFGRALGRGVGVAALVTGLCAAPGAFAQFQLDTVQVAAGLARPVLVTHAPGDFARVFIVEQRFGNTGRIQILNLASGQINAAPFLSVSPVTQGSEQGLLGLAFDPDYADNGHFYVNYTAPGVNGGFTVIARYTVSDNPDLADPGSAVQLVRFAQPDTNHNGGWIGFGPDRLLYIASGDGGGGFDQWGQHGNGQNKEVLLGKMLRIDPSRDDFPEDPERNYGIPGDNPFVDVDGADEVWAWGLRNPWRDSFDRLTGDLWIADVGQGSVEEVDFQAAGAPGGANYGWRCMEGNNCTGLSGCVCNDDALTDPIHTYTHGGNPFRCSITGGYVYRGCAIPDLDGTYFFADYCSAQIWSFRYQESKVVEFTERTAELDPDGGLSISDIVSFGEDAFGELYICDLDGEVYRIVPSTFQGPDCNENGVRDACDILAGTSADADGNGIPDECEEPCYADCDGAGGLDFFDFLCFQNEFDAEDPYADCDENQELDFFDFLCFLNAFDEGC